MFRQFFHHSCAHYLRDVQHTDRLGYKDVIAVDIQPNPHLVRYLQETLPSGAAEQRARWNAHHRLLTDFAVGRGLGTKQMTSEQRHKHYEPLRQALFPREPEETYEDDDDFPEDGS